MYSSNLDPGINAEHECQAASDEHVSGLGVYLELIEVDWT